MQSSTGLTDSPPPPPPLPPPSKVEKSSIALKVSSAAPSWAFEGRVNALSREIITPSAGPYFFYGTLQDPQMLKDILSLPELPVLFGPAYVEGYKLRLWGQYAALVDAPTGVPVKGSVWNVPSEEAAAKLAYYETNNYRPTPVNIYFEGDNDGSKMMRGYSFLFCGNPADLSDGEFDLDVWLRRMVHCRDGRLMRSLRESMQRYFGTSKKIGGNEDELSWSTAYFFEASLTPTVQSGAGGRTQLHVRNTGLPHNTSYRVVPYEHHYAHAHARKKVFDEEDVELCFARGDRLSATTIHFSTSPAEILRHVLDHLRIMYRIHPYQEQEL